MENEYFYYSATPHDSLLGLFIKHYRFYRAQNGEIVVVNNETKKWCSILNKAKLCNELRLLHIRKKHQSASKSVINNVYDTILAIADDNENEITIINNLEREKDIIIYDIKGSEKFVRIRSNDVRILNKGKSEYLFYNYNCTPVLPKLNEKNYKYIEIIKKIFSNVGNENTILLGVYIISLFIKNIQHPILIVDGEYGGGKTTFLRKIAKIVDPHSGDVIPLPAKIEDIAIILNNGYFTPFDNVSYLTRDIANLLCVSVTGGQYRKRKLYTDDEVSIIDISRPIAISGININLNYSDLLDRSIVTTLGRVQEDSRLTEEELWKQFNSILPALQGCIFRILSKAIAKYPEVSAISDSRLADFAKYGVAIAESIECGLGDEFLKELNKATKKSALAAIESDPLLNTLSTFIEEYGEFKGSVSELYVALKTIYFKINMTNTLPPSFPKAANVLSRRINSSIHDLEIIGLTAEISRNTNRYILIKKIRRA